MPVPSRIWAEGKSYYLEKLIASKAETLFYVFIESLVRSLAGKKCKISSPIATKYVYYQEYCRKACLRRQSLQAGDIYLPNAAKNDVNNHCMCCTRGIHDTPYESHFSLFQFCLSLAKLQQIDLRLHSQKKIVPLSLGIVIIHHFARMCRKKATQHTSPDTKISSGSNYPKNDCQLCICGAVLIFESRNAMPFGVPRI